MPSTNLSTGDETVNKKPEQIFALVKLCSGGAKMTVRKFKHTVFRYNHLCCWV